MVHSYEENNHKLKKMMEEKQWRILCNYMQASQFVLIMFYFKLMLRQTDRQTGENAIKMLNCGHLGVSFTPFSLINLMHLR